MSTRPRIVVAEDSRTQRAMLVHALEAAGDIVVVAEAASTDEVAAAVERERPDAVTMDLEMPGGGGQQAIERIMEVSPVPILVLSGLVADRGSRAAVAALNAGAADVLPKPLVWNESDAADLRRKVHVLSGVAVIRGRSTRRVATRFRESVAHHGRATVIALGASTGGPQALSVVLRALHGVAAPILCVQHIHASFTDGFAAWLMEAAGLPVVIATDGMPAASGVVYLAPAGRHLRLAPSGRHMELSADPDVINRPSIDELLLSVARHARRGARAALLTGMGDDGARGLLALRRAGGATFAQDEETCVVYGMPQAAVRLGAVDRTLPLCEIGPALGDRERVVAA